LECPGDLLVELRGGELRFRFHGVPRFRAVAVVEGELASVVEPGHVSRSFRACFAALGTRWLMPGGLCVVMRGLGRWLHLGDLGEERVVDVVAEIKELRVP